MRLSRLGQSLTGVLTSAGRTHPISLRRLRLPRLMLSRRVSCTNSCTNLVHGLPFLVSALAASSQCGVHLADAGPGNSVSLEPLTASVSVLGQPEL